jgi:crotonobetainyl-CoA:carnitine CoA-transferase CaiB-like acyl-CoA transferase
MGNAHPNIVPYQVFPVRDGHVIIAVGNDAQFERLCAYLGEPTLARDPRFATNAARVENRAQLVPRLSERLASLARGEVLDAMERQGIPAGPINTLADVFADPQVIHRNLCLNLPAPWTQEGVVPSVRTPIQFSGAQLQLQRPSPRLGEHTAEILAELALEKTNLTP